MTRDEWIENVRRGVESGIARSEVETPEFGPSMNMITEGYLLSVKPSYSAEEKPDFIQVTVGYPSPVPTQLSEASLNDAIRTAAHQMKLEYNVTGHVERLARVR